MSSWRRAEWLGGAAFFGSHSSCRRRGKARASRRSGCCGTRLRGGRTTCCGAGSSVEASSRPRIGIRGSCAESAGSERALQQAENVFGSLLDEELIDLFALEFEADEQASVGEQIDEAWNAAREAVDDFDGGAGERAGAAKAGGVKTLGHVRANFGKT